MDLLFELKNRLEFCLTGDKNLIKTENNLKLTLKILESKNNLSKSTKKICLLCRDLINSDSDNTTFEILNLIEIINSNLISSIDIKNTENNYKFSSVQSIDSNYMDINHCDLYDFYSIIYSTNSKSRDILLNKILAKMNNSNDLNNDLKTDFRIISALVYALDDKFIEVKNIAIKTLSSLDEAYIPYFKNEIEKANKNRINYIISLAKIIDNISKGNEYEYLLSLKKKINKNNFITKLNAIIEKK